ncbi:Tn3 family transposase [Ruegeria sp.]|uniref:Tn3 family transposase n=1 Tax=Ruegeria sp. TaxID=1879320 RepID=UPI003B594774
MPSGADMSDQSFLESWSLNFNELEFVEAFNLASRIWVAFQLRFFQTHGRFPSRAQDLSSEGLEYLAQQLDVKIPVDQEQFDYRHVNARRHRVAILKHLGVRRATDRDRLALRSWIFENCRRSSAPTVEEQVASAYAWGLSNSIYISSDKIMERLVRSARPDFLEDLLASIARALPANTRRQLDESLSEPRGYGGFHLMKNGVGAATLANVLGACERLTFIAGLELSSEHLAGIDPSWIAMLCRRVERENASEMRRHSDDRRIGLYALYLMDRQKRLTDDLIDLFLEITHRLQTRSRRRVITRIARDIERVYGKDQLLCSMAEAAIEYPEGRVIDVIYPVASVAKLKAVIEEHRASGTLDKRIQTVMRGSYANHYRRMMPKLLSVLRFRSNNSVWRPILDALERIAEWRKEGRRTVPVGSIPAGWKEFVVDDKGRLNVISYEICILGQLRSSIRAREIWVEGADRYRNPDHDLPADFDECRASYYADLGLPQDAQAFVTNIRSQLEKELRLLNETLPKNDKVRLRATGDNRICITPFERQPEPAGLINLKNEIGRTWPMTSLLDVLKETALDTRFLDCFESSASREVLTEDVRNRRLLLTLYGVGTNAGLNRIATGTEGVSIDELAHVYRRYVNATALRAACAKVANATLAIRDPDIWGSVGMACAADSTKFGAWDRNLMTEWHARYGGRGVMIYWHVERRATCIYSQLKRCSSSEVAAMIEGVLRHCTDMEIQRQYVDSHGQSAVGFAFAHLFGFELAPRLKAIASQKLMLASADQRASLTNLTPILAGVVDWDEIARQYDEMVKYAAAMQHGTADPESILRRFSKGDVMHPT